ncbi:MAG TPA: hypothetical protein EYM41_07530 [Dehalococcoidia bacterium]|nr:hypothetical protein [Dehalococcoidia bacterium]
MDDNNYTNAGSGTTHGKIRVYAQKGLELEEGWVLDADGHPTTDPLAGDRRVAQADRRLQGSVPRADYGNTFVDAFGGCIWH